MRVVVTGIPGVGKTTVMECGAKEMGMRIVNLGDVMFEIASEKGWIEDRDEMRKLPLEKQRELQILAAEKIYDMRDVIVDTHCTIRTPAGYWPGLPAYVLEKLKPDIIVLIEADPIEIVKRRKGDQTRERDAQSEESLHEHQMMNRAAAMAYAALTSATVAIVQNREGKVEEAVQQLVGVMRRYGQ